jgi:hypothetical protein
MSNSKKPIPIPQNQRILKNTLKVKKLDNSIETHTHGQMSNPALQAELDRFRSTQFLKVSGDIVKKEV